MLDVFQIMPNHIHGIISIENIGAAVWAGLAPAQLPAVNDNVGATLAVAQNGNAIAQNDRAGARPAPTNYVAGDDRATARVAHTTVGNITFQKKNILHHHNVNCKETRAGWRAFIL